MKAFFADEKIEYFSTLPWDDGYVNNPAKWQRGCGGRTVFGVTVFLMPYFVGCDEKRNVSRYAVSQDYHLYFSKLLARAQNCFSGEILGFCDNSPLDERRIALDGGLGVLGENGLLINEKYGSFVFIGSFVHLSEVELSAVRAHGSCLGCGKCKTACPAGCIGSSFDGCLSGLTQKKRRSEEENEAVLRGDLLWGCDVCQEVCPMNRDVSETPIAFFGENRISLLTSEVLDGLVQTDRLKTRAFGWRGEALLRENIALFARGKKNF